MSSFEKENWTEERKKEQQKNISNSFCAKKLFKKNVRFISNDFNAGGKNNG